MRNLARPLFSALVLWAALLVPAAAEAQLGSITGTVVNQSTGAPVAGAQVVLFSSSGTHVGTFTTDAGGAYTTGIIPSGTYYAYTANSSGLLNEYYDDLPCSGLTCDGSIVTSSTAIVVPSLTVRTANFALLPGGAITGTVRSAGGAALAGVTVRAWGRRGPVWSYLRQVITNASGGYAMTGLQPGTYAVFTDAPATFVDEMFDDVPCPGSCDSVNLDLATPVPVVSGAVASGRDFSLAAAGRLAGSVTDAGTGAAIPGVAVRVYRRTPSGGIVFAGDSTSDAGGQYSVGGLSSGTYVAHTSNSAGYIDETLDGLPCVASCPVTSGTDIAVTIGQTTARNIALARGGSIAGTVRAAGTMAPLANVSVDVYIRQSDLIQPVRSTSTSGSGAYVVTGLPTGSYYLMVRSAGGYIPQIYPGVPCTGSCRSREAEAAGQLVPVVAPAQTAPRDFALTLGGTISGQITAAGTATPLQYVSVAAVTPVGSGVVFASSASTDASGMFVLNGLPGGTYYLLTGNSLGLVNEIYPNVPCVAACDSLDAVAQGTPVVLPAGGSAGGRNLDLAPGGRITGTVTASGARVGGVSLSLYTNSATGPRLRAATETNPLGGFSLAQLPAGAYYLATDAPHALQLTNEVYDNLPCATDRCAPGVVAAGTPIQVTAGATSGGRHFDLAARQQPPGAPDDFQASAAGFDVRFDWYPPQTGGAATSYRVEAGLTPGTTVVTLSASGTSLTVPGAPPGRYFARVRAVNAFGVSPPSDEIVLTIAANGSSPPSAPDDLRASMAGDRLIATWSRPRGFDSVDGYRVEAGTGVGRADIAAITVGAPSFLYEPVPPGFYFLRVRAFNAAGLGPPTDDVLVIAGGAAAPPGRPSLREPAVAGSTVSLSWQAPVRGPVTSYVIEAGSAPGLSNLVVYDTGNTATGISFPGVPPGTYWVRLRAKNGLGVGLASGDVQVVVP